MYADIQIKNATQESHWTTSLNSRKFHYSKRIRCPVKGKIKASGEIISMRGSHNHTPEFDGHGLDVRTARGNWLRALRENPQESPMDAVLKERRRYVSNLNFKNPHHKRIPPLYIVHLVYLKYLSFSGSRLRSLPKSFLSLTCPRLGARQLSRDSLKYEDLRSCMRLSMQTGY